MCVVATGNGFASSRHLIPNTSLSHPYSSLDQAAVGAVKESYRDSNHYEFGGLILQDKVTKQFFYESPYTDLGSDHIGINYFVSFENKNLQIVAEYHTHPCYPFTHYPMAFSPQDVRNYLIHDKIGYMGNFCNGEVQKWDPHDITFLMELQDDGPFGLDEETTYGGQVVGKVVLNKVPDIQESIMDVPLAGYNDIK